MIQLSAAPDTFGQCHRGGWTLAGQPPLRALGGPLPRAGPRNLSQGGADAAAGPGAQLSGPTPECSRVGAGAAHRRRC